VTDPQAGAVIPFRPGTEVRGLVVRTESGFHRVLVGKDIVVCRAPKRLLMGERRTTTPVVIGDEVRAVMKEDGTGSIEEILARRTELIRGAAGGGRFLDVIAANLDLLVVVHSLREPDFNPARVDRFLVMAESADIRAILCLNKLDLVGWEEAEEVAEVYRRIGYLVIITCARTGTGIDELRDAITGHMSAVVGPSGVGKSSLLNRIQPGLHLRTAEVSDATGKGRHTTTTAELLHLVGGGYVADTPGLRELAIREVEQEDPAWLFPEFRPFMTACRFSNCTHREEVGCAVKEAVERGGISPDRYRSFRRIAEELAEQDRLALRS
jgi:ribosome biogenesis GTPase